MGKPANARPRTKKHGPHVRVLEEREYLEFFERHRDSLKRDELCPSGYGPSAVLIGHEDGRGRLDGVLAYDFFKEYRPEVLGEDDDLRIAGAFRFVAFNVIGMDVLDQCPGNRAALEMLEFLKSRVRRVMVQVPSVHWTKVYRRAGMAPRRLVIRGPTRHVFEFEALATAEKPEPAAPASPRRRGVAKKTKNGKSTKRGGSRSPAREKERVPVGVIG